MVVSRGIERDAGLHNPSIRDSPDYFLEGKHPALELGPFRCP